MRYQAETSEDLFCSSVYPIWIPFEINKTLLFFIQLTIAVEIYAPSGQVRYHKLFSLLLCTAHN
nr:unnamed protein product [Callosobruchus analis]